MGQYSLGMKQRLGIAMALLGSPKLLILDEPTNGLDPAGIQEMRSLIASMPQTTGATVLISSHLLGEIEQMVDQVGILNHGRLLFEGSLQQLQKHSRGGILLRVLDAPKAAAVLQQQGVKAAMPTDQPDTLQLPPLPDEALAALVCTLAERGVGVVGLTAQTKSLEDIFLSLTQTSGEWRKMAAFRAELQKAHHRHDLALCLLIPGIVVLWVGGLAPADPEELANGYSALLYSLPVIEAILMPVMMAVLASRLWDMEIKGNTAKLLYTLQSRRSLFAGKAVFGVLEVLLVTVLELA